jgi:FkbM family methyltransferase
MRLAAALSLAAKSITLDLGVMRLRSLTIPTRCGLTASKYRALALLVLGRPATARVGLAVADVSDISALGTLNSSIVDVGVLADRQWVTGRSPMILDVGANIGQFCLASKLFWPEASVLCFEPDPDVFGQLIRNTSCLSNVTAENVGLARRAGSLRWHRHELSVMSSFRSPTGDGPMVGEDRYLPVTSLDEATAGVGQIDLLKIDVEGFEVEVLAGASAVLSRTRLVLVEISFRDGTGESNLDAFEIIRRTRPSARVVGFGRPLGPRLDPDCADVLIDLGPVDSGKPGGHG